MIEPSITVKVLTKSTRLDIDKPSAATHGSFPGKIPVWGSCRFVFGNEQDYDWVVVYDDFNGEIKLNCPKNNTLLVTTEPSSIKTYESVYTSQFGHILTGQEDWALKHDGKIHSQPALFWFYGANQSKSLTYDQIANKSLANKTLTISTVTSSKCQKHTLHAKRYDFIQKLQQRLPELERFGKGIREVDDKASALDPYKYHIAIENHICDHWWTEKLSDPFLGLCLPFYHGAPNAFEYFPPESFISIDINDFEGSYRIITDAIKNNEYEKRLPAIKQARELVLKKYNFYSTVSHIIEQKNQIHNPSVQNTPTQLKSRYKLRKNPTSSVKTILEKIRNKWLSSIHSK
jgi:hypothetical protein